ncbi:MAG: hypothetical protein IJZ46_02220 [Bacilli bacterium]|nr:hypothetical protein [Bacilli bacterium]
MKKCYCLFIIMVMIILLTFDNKELSVKANEINSVSNEVLNFLEITLDEYAKLSDFDKRSINNINLIDSKKEVIYYEDTYVYNNYQSYLTKEQPISVFSKKISEIEYNQSTPKSGSIRNGLYSTSNYYETNAKKITLIINQISTDEKEKYILSTLQWKTMPSVRSNDVFAMRINNGYFIKNTQSGTYTYSGTTMDSACTGIVPLESNLNITTGWNKKNISTLIHGVSHIGVGYTIKLKENSLKCFNDLGLPMNDNITSMSFKIISSAYSTNSDNKVIIYSSYQHATDELAYANIVNNYDFISGGLGNVISFNNGYNSYFDGMGGVNLSN